MRIYSTKAPHHLRSGNLFAPSLVVALISVLTVVTGAAQSLNASLSTSPISIEKFGKVGDHYYRGSQPDATQFAELKRLGVKMIIDLRSDRLAESSQWARDAGMQYLNIPLTTKVPATEQQTAYFLRIVNDPANWPVYVHCKGGRHRTGEMTALYRITHEGWTADQAYEEMKKYDFEDGFFYPRSLKKYVFSYYQQFATAKHNN
jgi:protein tyrosine/serine phosphatase